MKSELLTIIIQVLVPVLLTALGTVVVALANNISQYLKQKANSNLLNRYIDTLNDIVFDVVMSLNQTTVAQLKLASTDGKLTAEEVNIISSKALESVKTILGIRGIEILKIAFEDIDALIANKIERAVVEAKALLPCEGVAT